MAGVAAPDPTVIERFSPSAGRWMGVATLALLVVVAGFVIATGRLGDQPGLLIGLATAALLCWVALVRPAVQARGDHLLLRNLVRDTEVPWHLVDQVRIAQTLRVQAGDKVHHGVAVGRSARSDMRAQREGRRHSTPTSPQYTDYVVDRITLLAEQQSAASEGRGVCHRWAWVELALGLVLTIAIVALALT